MKRISDKTRRLRDDSAQARRDFAFAFPYCFVCGDEWKQDRDYPFTLHTHEMVRGTDRHKAYGNRATWLRLCPRHHERIGDYTLAQQLALKLMHDTEHYDLAAVNSLRGRAENAITQEEVDSAFSDDTTDECPADH